MVPRPTLSWTRMAGPEWLSTVQWPLRIEVTGSISAIDLGGAEEDRGSGDALDEGSVELRGGPGPIEVVFGPEAVGLLDELEADDGPMAGNLVRALGDVREVVLQLGDPRVLREGFAAGHCLP
jgi:hypothetical protein